MIFVDRSGTPVPKYLTDPKGGIAETTRAMRLYANPRNANSPFKFEAYQDDSVHGALTALFRSKCAYCETPFLAASDLNVEHWRPKGRIADDTPAAPSPGAKPKKPKPIKPGYYWLAAEWTNLLLSCPHCNQRRRHKIDGKTISQGKVDQFPLAPQSPRARKPGEEEQEKPLLLNPCVPGDAPERHLEFPTDSDKRGTIRPRREAGAAASPRGEASIRVYALARPMLTLERRKRYIEIEEQVASVERQIALRDAIADQTARAMADANLRQELDRLKGFTEADRPYALMARQLVNAFLERVRA